MLLEDGFELLRRSGPVRVLICDDHADMVRRIHEKSMEIFDKLQMEAFFNLHSLERDITDAELAACDVAFLDIDLEGQDTSGIEVARRLRKVNQRALILFVTNFIEYAPEGYEVRAFRYILKRDLDTLLGRYLMQALEHLTESGDILRIKAKTCIREFPLDEVLYLEVQGHDITVHTLHENVDATGSLSIFERKLENRGFLRVHKSYLVNMRFIRTFQCREMSLSNGETIRVSEKSYAQQKRTYMLWKGKH